MPVVPFLLRAACEHADALGWYLAPGRTRRGCKSRGPVECVPPEAEPTSRRQADARIDRKSVRGCAHSCGLHPVYRFTLRPQVYAYLFAQARGWAWRYADSSRSIDTWV
jgi:hypothetical protein